jgi:hypothetical protein
MSETHYNMKTTYLDKTLCLQLEEKFGKFVSYKSDQIIYSNGIFNYSVNLPSELSDLEILCSIMDVHDMAERQRNINDMEHIINYYQRINNYLFGGVEILSLTGDKLCFPNLFEKPKYYLNSKNNIETYKKWSERYIPLIKNITDRLATNKTGPDRFLLYKDLTIYGENYYKIRCTRNNYTVTAKVINSITIIGISIFKQHKILHCTIDTPDNISDYILSLVDYCHSVIPSYYCSARINKYDEAIRNNYFTDMDKFKTFIENVKPLPISKLI